MKSKFKPSFFIKLQLVLSFFSLGILIFYFFSLRSQIEDSNKNRSVYKRFFEQYKAGGEGDQSLAKIVLPQELKHLPLGELVLKTKKVTIRNVRAPHNASIIKHGSGYLIFFRYDVKNKRDYSSYIGCAELDSNFTQTNKEFVKIETLNNHSEDPRVFYMGQEAYLLYVKSEFKKTIYPPFVSTMNLACIDLNNYRIKFKTELDPHFNSIEKNWSPFIYTQKTGHSHLYFQYSLNPHKILFLQDPQVNYLTTLSKDDSTPTSQWEKAGWGVLRGGTPAIKIGNNYLAFFHSSFLGKEGLIWYSMGAYTFESQPPFRITAISPYPILFPGIYDSVSLNTAEARKRVIFPTSFVIEEKNGKELIHLSCGENDSAIKIVTIDKEILLKSLKEVR